MLKKRLIFVLYYDAGYFFLSRNFKLQRVGDVRWLVEKFRFKSIGSFIDEIVILDVSRNPGGIRCSGDEFEDALRYLMRETFVPLTIGGGIKTLEDAQRCFGLGADKILLNTAILSQPEFVRQCVSLYGSQAVVGAIDVVASGDVYISRVCNGSEEGLPLNEHVEVAATLGVGEMFINSIDRDGTGMGFDLTLLDFCTSLDIPLIVAGGAGKPAHFAEILALRNVEAAATGNLFNFLGNGFESVRRFLVENGYPVRSE